MNQGRSRKLTQTNKRRQCCGLSRTGASSKWSPHSSRSKIYCISQYKDSIFEVYIVLIVHILIIHSCRAETVDSRHHFDHSLKGSSFPIDDDLQTTPLAIIKDQSEAIAVPIRIHSKTGNPVEHGHHFLRKRPNAQDDFNQRSRKRRSLYDDFDDKTRPAVANYTFEAFGRTFRLHLEPYSEFISPTYSLDYKGNMSQNVEDMIENVPRHCFFSGHVNAEMTHKVVVSLCGGMIGAFRVKDADFMIEPVYSDAVNENENVGTRPHRIYKRWNGTDTTSKTKESNCDSEHYNTTVNREQSYERYDEEILRKTTSQSHEQLSRKKRYISYPRNVEVMVTVDNEMKRAHNTNLQHYILTLIAIVHHIYLDPSIGNQINIILVRLVVIGDDEVERGPDITKNPHECLKNFCLWQATENNPDDTHPSHHDTAILITRQNLCRSEDDCDTLGLAELGTICDPKRSCSINEDNGLSTAFTIAHEMGHEFNAPHDNNEKCRSSSGEPGELHVMSPTLDHKTKPWSWSPCSAKYVTDFLDHGNGHCLLDPPPQRRLPLPSELPGQLYDINQQCSFVYGKGVNHCGFMAICARLWCVSENPKHGCRTPHMPWADGTKCGYRKWCKEGLCVKEDRDVLPVDGGWGEWSRFGECSRSCGGGVRVAGRECNNPVPLHDGRYCVGKRKKFRSCNWHECPTSSDFREEQCKSFDWSRHHFVRGIPSNANWIPKYDGILLQDRCKLICQVSSNSPSTAWYVLKPTVINGTPCGRDTFDMCVEGVCKRAGCDHILNSHTKLDDCGVCGGDNSGCRTVKGVFDRSEKEGYNVVTVIPSGSTNILIEQLSSLNSETDDSNYLALQDSAGRFILNGDRNIIQFEQTVEKLSTSNGAIYNYKFDYSGSDTTLESINSSWPVMENITVLVLSAGHLLPPNIKYRYNVPLPDVVTYTWDQYGALGACNSSCQGYIERKVSCVRTLDAQAVANHNCLASEKPPPLRMRCNTHCETKWRITKQECSARCGHGLFVYELECIKLTLQTSANDSFVNTVDEKNCEMHLKPANSISCYGECLATSWHYGEWSDCDHECGGGTQTRNATCKDAKGERPAIECDARVRFVSRLCNVFSCPQWAAGDFSKCLATCGTGIRRRRVLCRGPIGQILDNSVCQPEKKPPSTTVCHLQPCPTWKYEPWEKCSVSCGTGTSIRALWCADYLDRKVDHSKCYAGLREADTKTCSMPVCPAVASREESSDFSSNGVHSIIEDDEATTQLSFSEAWFDGPTEWRVGSWTQCSVTCGRGRRQRYVSCRGADGSAISEHYCSFQQRPFSSETCIERDCPAKWRSGAWSECSVSCGFGTKTRYVQCMKNEKPVESMMCEGYSKPLNHSICDSLPSCGDKNGNMYTSDFSTVLQYTTVSQNSNYDRWMMSDWSECSSSCGSGRRRRQVSCPGECSDTSRPLDVKLCDSGPCPHWIFDSWSKCSATCDRGIVRRRVRCVMPGERETVESRCNIMEKPPAINGCRIRRCTRRYSYRWRSSQWSECSATCGVGQKTRDIECEDNSRRVVDDAFCTRRREKPPRTRKCRIRRRCPRWHSGQWNRCSASCGLGMQVRPVECRYRRHRVASGSCGKDKMPNARRECNGTLCASYKWVASEWSTCSRTCGVGSKSRRLYCMDTIGKDIHPAYCSNSNMPSKEMPCYEFSCFPHWSTGSWTPCSVSCGDGMETRAVRCVRPNEISREFQSASDCNVKERPIDTRRCQVNICASDLIWRLGTWSKCSVTCGEGVAKRLVNCFNRTSGTNEPASLCVTQLGNTPKKTALCSELPCLPTSCRQITKRYRKDGEYMIGVRGKPLKVYCSGMDEEPHEFITLPSGPDDNYSEIYSYNLTNALTCPNNGTRNDSCSCTKNPQSGRTKFFKIRLHLESMKVMMNDFTHAFAVSGMPVPYAVAGDCYSKAACPQGLFQINLQGTGLVVSTKTRWSSYGRWAVQDIRRFKNGEVVNGKCGGYCGQCRPDPTSGLELAISGYF